VLERVQFSLFELSLKLKNVVSFRGASPIWLPDQGRCPWTPLGALPPDPLMGSCYRTRHRPPPEIPGSATVCQWVNYVTI